MSGLGSDGDNLAEYRSIAEGNLIMSVEGLLTWRSSLNARQTLERLTAAVGAAGMTIFAHVDHAAAAEKVGLSLPPMDLLIFGNPRSGTLLMANTPTLGIDLPLKALVWQDADGGVWLGFNAPAWLAARHRPPTASINVLDAMSGVQSGLVADILGTTPLAGS